MLERRVGFPRALPSSRSCRPSPMSRVVPRAPCAILPGLPPCGRRGGAGRRPRTCPSCPRRRAARSFRPTASTTVPSSSASAVRNTSGGTKTTVPAGASAFSSPTVNFARPRTTTYISSLPASSACGGMSWPPVSAAHALVPAGGSRACSGRESGCCPGTRRARSRRLDDVVLSHVCFLSSSSTTGSIVSSPATRSSRFSTPAHLGRLS